MHMYFTIMFVIFICGMKVIEASFGIFLVYMLLLSLCTVTYTLLTFTWMTKGWHMFLSILIWCAPFITTNWWLEWKLGLSTGARLLRYLMYLIPTGTLPYAYRIINQHDIYGPGLSCSNANEQVLSFLDYPCFYTFILQYFFLCPFYILLAWFINFCVTCERGVKSKDKKQIKTGEMLPPLEQKDNIEKPLPGAKPVIQIRKLDKIYGRHKAVNQLDLDVYSNMITILLGESLFNYSVL